MHRNQKFLKPFFLCALVPTLAFTQDSAQKLAEQEIRAFIETARKASLKGGPEFIATMDKVLADEFVRIPGNGAIITKSAMFEGFRSGKNRIEDMVVSDIKVYLFGDSALATGIQAMKGNFMDTNYLGKTRFSRMFIRRDGRWQCVLYQNTPVAP